MRTATRAAAILAAAAALFTGVHAVQKVSRAGRYLYTEDGNRFFIKGVAYQEQGDIAVDPNNRFLEPSSFIDPLADGDACTRDLPFLQQLGVNTIRVYSVNSSLNHDSCMSTFSGANIYTIIDLSLPVNGSIDRSSPSWAANLLDLYISTIDVFTKYDNVLAYNVGNEVVIAPNGTAAAAYVKAAARDTKAYLASKSSSALVGYAAIDGDSTWIDPLANYLSCDPSGGNSGNTAIDLFGLNNYEWCGDASASAYANKNAQFAGYNVPAYFSEFGCITSPPRLWTETQALFSEPMTDIWSGGLAFSYFPATSSQGQFGMITIGSDGSVQTSDDFDRLKTQYGQLSPPNSPSQSSAGSTNFPSCPQQNSSFLASTTLPPTPNFAACACLESTLSCQFTPQTPNYGPVSACDPSTKLSFVMSQFFEANNRNPETCNFAGNATINQQAPSSVSAANSVASSCLSNPSATFTPSAPASTGSGSSNGNGGSGGSNNNNSGAVSDLFGNRQAWVGLGVGAVFSLMGGLITLV
ncbi:unnamed protein product [Somion occarium]|uniref:1,3-beta-glucanosyltransferase n=1 Tax=Somion occarium TaxID=3059160 RepID=A0ABP1CNT8_9APHY